MAKNLTYIAIADDHPHFVAGIKYTLNSFPNCQVIIEAYNGEQLLSEIEKAKTKPAICLLDIRMPVMNGYETLKRITHKWPDIKVIILSMHYNEFSILKTFRDGACACLPKEVNPEELQKAISEISKRGFYHSELTSQSLYNLAHNKSTVSKVNDKEVEFLRYCASELSYMEIAKKMNVSARTIDGYRDHLFEKLNLKSRTALAIFAMKCGLITI